MNYELTWFLRRHADERHSLDDLAAACGLTPAQVSGAVSELERVGFLFDHHPMLGLSLAATPVTIDRDELAFARSGRRVGHTVHVYDQTASTSDVALSLAARGERTDGLVVVAEEQTAGRGRQGAAWFGSRGESLLLSVVHWMAPGPDAAAEMMLAASVAVAEAVQGVSGLRTSIKWPNDIEVARRKVAGILIESAAGPAAAGGVTPGEALAKAPFVIGVGLNVNQAAGAFPADIADRAGSLAMAAGRQWDRVLLLENVLEGLEETLRVLQTGPLGGLLSRYMSHADIIGRCVELAEGNRRFRGTVSSISPHYALVLRLEDGAHRWFNASQVRLL